MQTYSFYKKIYDDFKALCAEGRQRCSFNSFCRERGVKYDNVAGALGKEFSNIRQLPGYRCFWSKPEIDGIGQLCRKVYDDFSALCAEGRQPGSFAGYYRGFGITREQMRKFQKSRGLRVMGLPGFTKFDGCPPTAEEVSFEDVLFGESGFMPSASPSVITVRVEGGVEVSFPSDTDVAVIVDFITKIGKEGRHVGA